MILATSTTPCHFTYKVTTNAGLRSMHLSFFTLSRLADVLNCVDPTQCLEHRLTHRVKVAFGLDFEDTTSHWRTL